MFFTYNRGSLCVFVKMIGLEPTAFCSSYRRSTIDLHLTYYDVLPQLLNKVLLYSIQHTTYLLSRGLLSSTSRPMYANPSLAPTSRWYCVQALRSDPSDKYTTLSHTNWQVGLVLRSAPPVTLCLLVLPLRGLKPTFFPTHLLHCYNHRSYQWSHPHGCEQACIDEPLLAQSCRRILLWAYH